MNLMELQVIKPPAHANSRGIQDSRTVLTISDNSQIGLWLVRSLGRAGLTVFNLCPGASDLAGRSRFVDGAWLLDIPATSDEYGRTVLEYARRLKAASVMTIAEASHRALLEIKDLFVPDVHLFSPPHESFNKATDKGLLKRLCATLDIPIAKGDTLENVAESRSDKDFEFPLVVRVRDQLSQHKRKRFPWKVAYVSNKAELDQIYSDYSSIADNLLVEEYHPGAEEHVHVLFHQGQPFMHCAYIGEHHMPLAGGVTVRRITCDHPGPRRDAVVLLNELQWDGIATVQFHYDPRTQKYIFLEINPRFCAGLPTVIMAGFDSPFMLWQSVFEPELLDQRSVKLGLRTRLLGGDVNWLRSMLRGDQLPPSDEKIGKVSAIADFLRGFSPMVRDDIFMLEDPRPYFFDLRNMLRL